ncbi:FecCD family ABC transporter permease [Spongisporangium articulatum]|uniref:FecCD family ABC transporter permease n=1 Tax=Spongisporangium articulatum TaxID=3362603 RepID=A0ABW8ARC3_9ACTN
MSTITALRGAVLTGRRPAVAARAGWVALFAVLLGLAVLASVALGTRVVGWDAVQDGVAHALGWRTGASAADAVEAAAVEKRVPRTLLAMLVGAALGLSGAVMQGVTRNPLADPGLLGVTTGASLAVVASIAYLGVSSAAVQTWIAIGGAAGSAAFVYAVGSLGRGGATPLKLALAGSATSAAFVSLISVVMLPRQDLVNQFRFWQIGGVGGATFERIGPILPFLAVGLLFSLSTARGLNSLALGDDLAAGLGERTGRTRSVAFVGSVVLCGAATAMAGPIAFVGLLVPHSVRLLIGVDHRWLLPASALVGAVLLTVADVVGRVIARPEEIDVGVVTAFIGAPLFIWIVRRQRVRSL